MDSRGLKLGTPSEDGKRIPLEIANLEPEQRKASADAQENVELMSRVSGLSLWALATMGQFFNAAQEIRERFSLASEAYEEFVFLSKGVKDDDRILLKNVEDEVACALCMKWPSENSEALRWAKRLVLRRTAMLDAQEALVRYSETLGKARARAVIHLATIDPLQSGIDEALAYLVTEPIWAIRNEMAMAIAEDLAPLQPKLAEILVTGLAQYAEALVETFEKPYRERFDAITKARVTRICLLRDTLKSLKSETRPQPSSLVGVKEWLVAISAARGESHIWRVRSLITLTKLAADQESQSSYDEQNPDGFDFVSRLELARLFSVELLEQSDESSLLVETLDYCIEKAPILSAHILESTLVYSDKKRFSNSDFLWRIWDRSSGKVFPQSSLREEIRSCKNKYDGMLKVLLLCSVPWSEGLHNLSLLRTRPRFVHDCLIAVGDSRIGLRYLLQVTAGIGRASALPSALPQLRDALGRAPVDVLDDEDCLWNAETICRVAVHEHRETLIRDIRLRRATLDILDRLVDVGSSLGFQLRDYLATVPSTPSQKSIILR